MKKQYLPSLWLVSFLLLGTGTLTSQAATVPAEVETRYAQARLSTRLSSWAYRLIGRKTPEQHIIEEDLELGQRSGRPKTPPYSQEPNAAHETQPGRLRRLASGVKRLLNPKDLIAGTLGAATYVLYRVATDPDVNEAFTTSARLLQETSEETSADPNNSAFSTQTFISSSLGILGSTVTLVLLRKAYVMLNSRDGRDDCGTMIKNAFRCCCCKKPERLFYHPKASGEINDLRETLATSILAISNARASLVKSKYIKTVFIDGRRVVYVFVTPDGEFDFAVTIRNTGENFAEEWKYSKRKAWKNLKWANIWHLRSEKGFQPMVRRLAGPTTNTKHFSDYFEYVISNKLMGVQTGILGAEERYGEHVAPKGSDVVQLVESIFQAKEDSEEVERVGIFIMSIISRRDLDLPEDQRPPLLELDSEEDYDSIRGSQEEIKERPAMLRATSTASFHNRRRHTAHGLKNIQTRRASVDLTSIKSSKTSPSPSNRGRAKSATSEYEEVDIDEIAEPQVDPEVKAYSISAYQRQRSYESQDAYPVYPYDPPEIQDGYKSEEAEPTSLRISQNGDNSEIEEPEDEPSPTVVNNNTPTVILSKRRAPKSTRRGRGDTFTDPREISLSSTITSPRTGEEFSKAFQRRLSRKSRKRVELSSSTESGVLSQNVAHQPGHNNAFPHAVGQIMSARRKSQSSQVPGRRPSTVSRSSGSTTSGFNDGSRHAQIERLKADVAALEPKLSFHTKQQLAKAKESKTEEAKETKADEAKDLTTPSAEEIRKPKPTASGRRLHGLHKQETGVGKPKTTTGRYSNAEKKPGRKGPGWRVSGRRTMDKTGKKPQPTAQGKTGGK